MGARQSFSTIIDSSEGSCTASLPVLEGARRRQFPLTLRVSQEGGCHARSRCPPDRASGADRRGATRFSGWHGSGSGLPAGGAPATGELVMRRTRPCLRSTGSAPRERCRCDHQRRRECERGRPRAPGGSRRRQPIRGEGAARAGHQGIADGLHERRGDRGCARRAGGGAPSRHRAHRASERDPENRLPRASDRPGGRADGNAVVVTGAARARMGAARRARQSRRRSARGACRRHRPPLWRAELLARGDTKPGRGAADRPLPLRQSGRAQSQPDGRPDVAEEPAPDQANPIRAASASTSTGTSTRYGTSAVISPRIPA